MFLAEKKDIERRVAYVLEHKNHDELLAWAVQDRDLIHGMSGLHRTVVDPDPLRQRLPGGGSRDVAGDRRDRNAVLEPASENDFVCERTPGLWPLLSE